MKLPEIPGAIEIPNEVMLEIKGALRLTAEGMISSIQEHLVKMESKDKREALVTMFELKNFFQMISEAIANELD